MTTISQATYRERFTDTLDTVENFLTTQLAAQTPGDLGAAMRHAVLSGGKRLRPVLLMETCRACGGSDAQSLGTAAALEAIHAYSLIHDDLPCMDDDDWRRGQPTVHKAFSEATAILAGDALNAMAFSWVVDQTEDVSAEALLRVVSALALATGSSERGLVGGQAADLAAENAAVSEAALLALHRGKTGALFRFATWAGATLAGQPDALAAQFAQFGDTLGLAFQIRDDLLDVIGSREALGKTPGKDAAQGKLTFPAVYGVSGSETRLAEELTALDGFLKSLPAEIDTGGLATIIRLVGERTS